MKKILTGMLFVLFMNSCVVGPPIYKPVEYVPQKPQYLIICKQSPDNGQYIWKKECLVLFPQ